MNIDTYGANPPSPGEARLVTRELEQPARYCVFACPKDGHECRVPLKAATVNGWNDDGNWDQPTLTPSIQCHGCGWHGFIQNGKTVDC